MSRVSELELKAEADAELQVQKDISLAQKFSAISAENASLKRKLQRAKEDILALQGQPHRSSPDVLPSRGVSAQELADLAHQVASQLNISA